MDRSERERELRIWTNVWEKERETSLYRTRSKMASDDTKPSFTLTYNKPTAKKIEYEDDFEDEDDDIEQETSGGGFEQETKKKKKKKKTTLAAANGRVAPPCCQVENCGVDLTNERYYRRHKVCQVHAKSPVVIVAGTRQRFCQQCSRFHEPSEFDKAKRSCRKRLAGHNERRRKFSSETQEVAPSIRGPSPKLKEIQHGQANERGSAALPGKSSSYEHFRMH